MNKDWEVSCSAALPGRRLRSRRQRRAAHDWRQSQEPFYLNAWAYVRGGSEGLAEDFSVPKFERAPDFLSSNAVLGNSPST